MGNKITGVKGMEDLHGKEEAKTWQRIEQQARSLFETAGFQEIRTPVVEDAALFERGVGAETEIVEKEMYTLLDRNGHRLALRPEGTASVVRAFIEHYTDHQRTEGRFYYLGPMFRYERPQKGRLRQFHQIGAEIFGADHPLVDAELIALAAQLLKDAGAADCELHLNSLGSGACRENYMQSLVNYLQSVAELLCDDCRRRIIRNPLRALDCKKPSCIQATQNAPLIADSWSEESRKHFERVQSGLKDLDVPFVISPRLVRGLDYYERTVFEFTSKSLGAQNAVAAGGRYNNLVEDLGGPSVPGVGFALGMERLVALLPAEAKGSFGRPRVYLIGLGEAQEAELFRQLKGLREVGVVAEMDYGEGALKHKLKRADRWGAQWVILFGEDEAKKGVVVVRSMSDGSQEEIPFAELFMRIFSKLPTLMQIG